jgi:hypothetical protein
MKEEGRRKEGRKKWDGEERKVEEIIRWAYRSLGEGRGT